MTPMLEKIARAMVAAEKDEWDLPAEKWSVQALEDHGLMGLARIALLAMRNPDDTLGWIGAGIIQGHVGGSAKDAAMGCFTGMIDAIRAQPSTPTDVTPA